MSSDVCAFLDCLNCWNIVTPYIENKTTLNKISYNVYPQGQVFYCNKRADSMPKLLHKIPNAASTTFEESNRVNVDDRLPPGYGWPRQCRRNLTDRTSRKSVNSTMFRPRKWQVNQHSRFRPMRQQHPWCYGHWF